jgi:hypothetical protein
MAKSLQKWMQSGKYLPRFMRDFHDQKDVFKAIHEIINENEAARRIGWVDAQIYVIDVFLWFMARRGYTLQRSRVKCEFLDIDKTIADQNEARRAAYLAVLPMGPGSVKPVVQASPTASTSGMGGEHE